MFTPRPNGLWSPRFRGTPRVSTTRASALTGKHSSEIAIIGAGPASVAFLSNLALTVPELASSTVVLDRDGVYCRRFLDRCDALQQRTLRSPYEHHVGTHRNAACELIDFGKLAWSQLTRVEREQVRLAQMGERSLVPLDIFEAHVAHLIQVFSLERKLWRAVVNKVSDKGDHCIVSGVGFEVAARFVIIATGEAVKSEPLSSVDSCSSFDLQALQRLSLQHSRVGVVGRGLSSAYVINNLLELGNEVVWQCRGNPVFQCSDVNAKYFRPEGRFEYTSRGPSERRAILYEQRRATIMHEFYPILKRAIENRQLTLSISPEVDSTLASVMATGTSPEFPKVEVQGVDVTPMSDGRSSFYCTNPNYSISGSARVFGIGVHGSWAGGPAARNFDGMRFAAESLSSYIGKVVRSGRP